MIRERVAGLKAAVDLDVDEILGAARRRRKLAAHTTAVDAEITRLTARADRLAKKASRLRIGSNGRQAAVRDAQICAALAGVLKAAIDGQKTPKVEIPSTSRHIQRGTELLHQLQAV